MPGTATAGPAPRPWLAAHFATLRPSPDALGVGAVLVLTGVLAWDRLRVDRYLARTDLVTLFLTWHAYLGERLRAFDIPGWNPYQFGGAPFAGDPQSGWMYLPTMATYALLPPVTALQVFLAFHFALAGLSTYALARRLGLGALAATVAAAAFECAPMVENARCCPIRVFGAAWLPLALLGSELAIRARGWPGRVAGWGVAGLAISQMLGGWIGQGAYNGLLVVGAWVGYRTLVAPPHRAGLRRRAGSALAHGGAVLVLGFGLAAAGVLPRLLANRDSNLAGGDYAGQLGGEIKAYWPFPRLVASLLNADPTQVRSYAGGAVLALALLAPVLAGRRYGVPCLAAVTVTLPLLILPPTTPLHDLVFLLPQFEVLHEHVPSRILSVWAIGPALLAGATTAALLTGRWRPVAAAALVGASLLAFASTDRWIQASGLPAIPDTTWTAVLAGSAGVLALALAAAPTVARRSWSRPARGLVGVLLILAVTWDPVGRQLGEPVPDQVRRVPRAETMRIYAATGDPGGAGEFLQERMAAEGPFRYFGYDAGRLAGRSRNRATYHGQFRERDVVALLAVARSVPLGLHDVQGYNAIQRQRYVEWLAAVNGRPSNYHDGYVFAPGLSSPLLRLLNVRYLIVPQAIPPGRPDLFHLNQRYPTVYADDQVRVLEVTDALPRAWIVHDARQTPRSETLAALASGLVDPAQVALIEESPPPLARPADPSADRAVVEAYEPDRIVVRATTAADGLLVLSEVYDEGWTARVDGQDAPVMVADHLLRAVPVPAGSHLVELRYEPPGLAVGMAISLTTAGAIAAALLAAWVGARRSEPTTSGGSGEGSRPRRRLRPTPRRLRSAAPSPRPGRSRRRVRTG